MIFVAGWLLQFCAVAACEEQRATLHFKIVSQSGKDLGFAEVTSLQRLYPEIGKNQARDVKENVIGGLPYGTYRIRLHVKGFRTAEREVHLYKPEVWTVIQLQIGEEGGPSLFEVRGRVNRKEEDPTNQTPWLRLTGIYSAFVFDAKDRKSVV